MKRFDVLARSATAGAVVLLVAACGGGGGSSSGTPAASTPPKTEAGLQLSGTAATGAALANATVSVKCVTGTGTATTDANGAYSLKLTGGALPCVINVTGSQGGVSVSLHSLAEAGSTDAAGNTTAAANVTPLTEMIVAQLSASLPSDLFASFGAGSQVGTDKLVAATNAVLSALKAATGIDLGSIDPFKTQLVAATTSAPDAGNAYDKLLDQLGDKVGPDALPQVVNQIASAAGTGGSGLTEVMASVEKGSLPGCGLALSGKYRTLDFFGRTTVRDIDFKAMTYRSEDGTVDMTVTADPAKACEFVANGMQDGNEVRYEFAMGVAGMAAYRIQNMTSGRSSVGYLFPVQSHAKAALGGAWDYLESGYLPGDSFVHLIGKATINANDTVNVCDIDVRNAPLTCVPDAEANLSLAARTDGGFDLMEAGEAVANLYGYRAPNGALNLFATTNPSGANTTETQQSHLVFTKLQALTIPSVGTVSKYWDVQFERSGTENITSAPNADSTTVNAVESGNVVIRKRTSDGRLDRVRFNDPLPGLRHREAGQNVDGSPFAEIYQFGLNGGGFNVSINAVPTGPNRTHIYAIGMQRP